MSEQFADELRQTIKESKRLAKWNFAYAHIVFALSVLGSFIATVLASNSYQYPAVTAICAALPGLMLLINNTLRFEERTKWFWRKARMAEGYFRKLRDRVDPKTDALSSQYSEESEKLEADWPAFGSSPGQPQKPGAGDVDPDM